jgi:hypothetical protein
MKDAIDLRNDIKSVLLDWMVKVVF